MLLFRFSFNGEIMFDSECGDLLESVEQFFPIWILETYKKAQTSQGDFRFGVYTRVLQFFFL